VQVQQRVLQRARAVTGARVHDETHGLVDHEQGRIGMHDVDRNGLGLHRHGRFELGIEHELLAAPEQRSGLGLLAADREPTGVDPAL